METKFMDKAIEEAIKCLNKPKGGPFGAVITKNGQLVGVGCNLVTENNDPTAHAEVTAIRDACNNLNTFDLSDCEIYTSCEPCPMCLSAILWARMKTIYYGANRADAAKAGFDDQAFYDELNKPIPERSVPMIECSREAALKIFDAWEKKEDKIEY